MVADQPLFQSWWHLYFKTKQTNKNYGSHLIFGFLTCEEGLILRPSSWAYAKDQKQCLVKTYTYEKVLSDFGRSPILCYHKYLLTQNTVGWAVNCHCSQTHIHISLLHSSNLYWSDTIFQDLLYFIMSLFIICLIRTTCHCGE